MGRKTSEEKYILTLAKEQALTVSKRNGFEVVVGNDGEIMFLPSAQRDGGSYLAHVQDSSCGSYQPDSSGFTQTDDDELPF